MNARIIYYGVQEFLECNGVYMRILRDWDEIRIDRVKIPHMLHLLRLQGLPVASMFTGELKYDGRSMLLRDWALAKCDTSKMWDTPHYMRNVVLVQAPTKEQTMVACVRLHNMK